MVKRLKSIWLLMKALQGSMAGNSYQQRRKKKSGQVKYNSLSSAFLSQLLLGLIISATFLIQSLTMMLTSFASLPREDILTYARLALTSDALLILGMSASYIVSIFFLSKSDDILLSYPIRPFDLFLARGGIVLVYSFMYSLLYLVHSLIFAIFIAPSFLSVFGAVISSLSLPFISVALGFVVVNTLGKIFNIRKNKGISYLISVIFGLIAGFSFYFLLSGIGGDTTEEVSTSIHTIFSRFEWLTWMSYLPLEGMFGASVGRQILFIVLQILLVGVLLLLSYFVANVFYIKNLGTEGIAKKKKCSPEEFTKRLDASFTRSRPGSFYPYLRKELSLNHSNPSLFISALIIPLASIASMTAFLFGMRYGGDNSEAIFASPGAGFAFAAGSLIFIIAMPYMSYISLSAEGKTIYSLKATPLDYSKYLDSKIVFGSICDLIIVSIMAPVYVLGLQLDPWLILYCLLGALSLILPSNEIGLLLGITYARFDWDNINELQNNIGGLWLTLIAYIGMPLMIGIEAVPVIFLSTLPLAPLYLSLIFLFWAFLFTMCFLLLRRWAQKKFAKLMNKDI
ncbi:MAG: hypothetical protein LKJ88_01710 [Bacilli bacterium]|jgi:hypothetical protein|nr:hypothetical protein [Bacilli bacterium]